MVRKKEAIKKCLVMGCPNSSDQGAFVGDLCSPCYKYLRKGIYRFSRAFTDAFKTLQKDVYQNATDHGFWANAFTTTHISEKLLLIHTEVSEAAEALRKDTPKGSSGWLGEELADVVIRVMDLCEHLDIDLVSEILKKHEINKSRPYKHNKKF